MPPTSDKWKHFELLVAAIHRAADQGADVRWDETIRGRQFDVTIRFRKGFYEYLTVVECKDCKNPVSVEKVEAFVTKSSDAQAHHAVMASTSGFQSGAQEVARRHNLTLLHVTDSADIDPLVFGAQWVGTTDVLHFQRIELEYTDGERKQLPEEANKMTYYVKQVRIRCGAEQASLEDVIQSHSPEFLGGEVDAYQYHAIACPPSTCVIGPDDDEIPLKPLACLHVRASTTKARILDGPVRFDPYLLVPDVKVRNIATGEEKTFSQHRLALGVNNTFVAGRFYEQPQAAMYYFCESVEGGVAHLYLVESFQHGQLIQAELTMKTEYANRYVPISDKAVIHRLQRRLDRLKPRPIE
jgi:hypothetical protein